MTTTRKTKYVSTVKSARLKMASLRDSFPPPPPEINANLEIVIGMLNSIEQKILAL